MTITELLPTGQDYRYHIRFDTYIQLLEFTSSVQDAKLNAERYRLKVDVAFAQVLTALGVEDCPAGMSLRRAPIHYV